MKEAGDEGGTANRVWVRVQESKSRLKHLKKLKSEGLGLNVDEFYLRKTNLHRRSYVCHGRRSKKVITASMDMRVKNERGHLKELQRLKNEAKKDLAEKYGRGSMKFKRSITKLNKMCEVSGRREDGKHEEQLHHLKRKHFEARKQREDWRMMKHYKTKWRTGSRGLTYTRKMKKVESSRSY